MISELMFFIAFNKKRLTLRNDNFFARFIYYHSLPFFNLHHMFMVMNMKSCISAWKYFKIPHNYILGTILRPNKYSSLNLINTFFFNKIFRYVRILLNNQFFSPSSFPWPLRTIPECLWKGKFYSI